MQYSISSTVQTLANWCCIWYTLISFIAKANNTPNVVVACSLITTDIVKTFIDIYREQLTTDSYQLVNTSCKLHKCDAIASQRETGMNFIKWYLCIGWTLQVVMPDPLHYIHPNRYRSIHHWCYYNLS